jgi:hypothetical protein
LSASLLAASSTSSAAAGDDPKRYDSLTHGGVS